MPASEAERSLDWNRLIETALTVPGHMGNQYNRFYEYSFVNQLLLMMQGVEPQPVATYKRWAAMGRQVVRGSKAKEIIRPMIFEKEDEAGTVIEKKVRFKAVRCIFALCDTVGDELPEVEVPGWDLDQALEKLDIQRKPYESYDGNTQGHSWDRNLAINPLAVHPGKTLMHEVGHIVLGHTTPDKLAEYETHRGIFEFQAESTAYLTMHELGQLPEVEAAESRAYIQGWLRDERPSDTDIRQVFTATDQILKAGRPQTAEAEA